MINVKGTKNALPEPQAAQRYVAKSDDEVSRKPLIVGGLLMGIAAYLGSMFSWGQESAPPSQPGEPAVGAAEIENPEGLVDDIASSNNPPEVADAEPPGSEIPTVANAPRPMSVRSPVENEGAAAGSARGNAGIESTDRVGAGISTPPIDIANPAGHRFSLGGNGPRGDESSPDDVSPVEGKDPTDGAGSEGDGSSSDSDSSEGDGSSTDGDSSSDSDPTEGDDDVDTRPDGNRAPRVSGPVYLMDVAPCAMLAIALGDLLSKAVDPDGDVLSVQNLAVSSGALTQAEGGWLFHNDSGQLGPVTITYQITDGELKTDAIARFSVVEQPVIVGTSANDLLLGSLCADEIDGAGGDDNIDGRAGDDVINGGAGDDHIVAGDGDDVVFGGDGNDIIFGGAGNDHLFGGSGDDRLFGDDGDDVLFGNAGADHLSGGDGGDLLLGGDGHDVIMDGAGRDNVFGGMGSDRIVAALDADDDVYDGGEGSDTIDYSHATQGLVVDLMNGIVSGVEIGRDFITGFENVTGSREADQFILGGESVALTGGTGDDVFAFANAGEDQPIAVSHVIMDFGVGDRIRISEFDIFWQADHEPGDRFEQTYHGADDGDLPIRYRHDRDDVSEWTMIEIKTETDFADDAMWATAVSLKGVHQLSWSTERDDSFEWLS
ncbi:cadherin-like domain-containing protein [Halomonas sp. SpR8]|uniref:calcium-binding protein n=1 Tax=Halomonas sp. SpR8 TaxID=3050463 RepID=UPI0027E573C9|nr:cadherin-like domain-containing protein [Halomonas sp. SpR8]MDQ7727603.1 cadherin-like domain-containing protein [Halomonas sp. SpR8]